MKNILVVVGGGRANGNTMQLADSFIQGAKDAGHTIGKISLLKAFLERFYCIAEEVTSW